MGCRLKKKRKVLVLPLLLSLLMPCMVNTYLIALAETKTESPEPVFMASLDRESVRVGDMVWLTLQYHLPDGARLPEKAEIRGIEELTITERVQEIGQIRIRFLVDRLGAWKSGPISLTYVDKDGNEKMMNADPVSLTVLSNLGEKPEEAVLRPIQDIVPLRPTWLTYLPWAAALAGLFLIIAVVTWWYRKRHSRDIFPEVMDPPHIKARKEIEQLEGQGLFEKGKVKTF